MKKRKWSVLLTVIMLFVMSTTAFAAETTTVPTIGTGTETQGAEASIIKNLEMAEGITVPSATFRFEITPITKDAPKATIEDISYTAKDTLASGVSQKTASIKFGEFPHAGVYEYEVKEVQNTYTGEGTVSYSTDVYKLYVYVVNKTDGTVYIQTITAEKNDAKQAQVVFVNTYRNDSSLEIEKQTVGDLADKTKKFDFTIKFTNAQTSDKTEFVGKIDGKPLNCTVGQEVPFQLKDGQKLVFDTLPAGTRYVVKEIGAEDGYTPKVTVVENGTELPIKQANNEKEDLTSIGDNEAGNLVGEGENKVTFVNTYHEVPITGIFINNLPFIVMIGVTILALISLVVFKRRRVAKR